MKPPAERRKKTLSATKLREIRIASLRLAGYSVDEIAIKEQTTKTTINRVLKQVEESWKQDLSKPILDFKAQKLAEEKAAKDRARLE
jgi:transposase